MLRMTGFLLEDLHAVRDLLQETRYRELTHSLGEMEQGSSPEFDEAKRQVYRVMPLAVELVDMLNLKLGVPGSTYDVEHAEELRRRPGPPHGGGLLPGSQIADFAAALGLLLDVTPDALTALWDGAEPVCDRDEVVEVLGDIGEALSHMNKQQNPPEGWRLPPPEGGHQLRRLGGTWRR